MGEAGRLGGSEFAEESLDGAQTRKLQENGQIAASVDAPEKLISSRLVRPPPMTAAKGTLRKTLGGCWWTTQHRTGRGGSYVLPPGGNSGRVEE